MDRGTLTSRRPRASGVVTKLHAKHPACKRPQGAVEVATVDDTGGFCRGRVTIVDIAPEWMVNRCGAGRVHVAVESAMSNTPPDPRDRAIGAANRANVHRLLSSLAIYPFSQGLR